MKPLVLFHNSCADGFGAAFAAWLKFGDEAEYMPMQYGEKNFANLIEKCTNREVYILDFSFPRPTMDAIFEYAKHVTWLDHHKTSFEAWCGEYEKGMVSVCNRYGPTKPCEVVLNDNKSGAMLAWEHFHPGTEVPMLVRMIDDRDRWQFKIPGSKELNAAIWSLA